MHIGRRCTGYTEHSDPSETTQLDNCHADITNSELEHWQLDEQLGSCYGAEFKLPKSRIFRRCYGSLTNFTVLFTPTRQQEARILQMDGLDRFQGQPGLLRIQTIRKCTGKPRGTRPIVRAFIRGTVFAAHVTRLATVQALLGASRVICLQKTV